jgi:hypothetical protein
MQDVNVSDDLRQLSLGQVKALEYFCYDINGYHFWAVKLEASCPLATTRNSEVVANCKDASGLAADYYGVLQNIIEYTSGGTEELKFVFFECDWFDLVNGTRVDDFGMVEVKHKSRYSKQQTFVCTSSATGVLPKLSSRKHETLVGGV